MAVLSMQQRRFEAEKEIVHKELVNYFVSLDSQRKLWYFTLAINLNANSQKFSLSQAENLVGELAREFDIRRIHIEMAIAFATTPFKNLKKSQNVIPLVRGRISEETFEDQVLQLRYLIEGKILEFRQALDLTLILLDNYPAALRNFS
jgi:hypothetical protein